jgi:hypothetical protein
MTKLQRHFLLEKNVYVKRASLFHHTVIDKEKKSQNLTPGGLLPEKQTRIRHQGNLKTNYAKVEIK